MSDKRKPAPGQAVAEPLPTRVRTNRIGALMRAIRDNDEARIEDAVLRLSRSRRIFAPLGLAVGAVVLLFDGVRLLVTNWRLTLVQILPAMWVWLAMFDLKLHALHGKSFNALRGPILIPINVAIVALTVASFFLNAVFAFAVAQPRRPEIRPAVADARRHLAPIVAYGTVVGLLLGFSTAVVTRWGRPWFTLALGIVVGLMMLWYVALPARLLGVKPTQSRRDKLLTTAVGGAIGVAVCTPPYVLGRIGVLMLGSKFLLIPGIIVFAVGVTLQAGATGAVRAIKVSARLATGRRVEETAQNASGGRLRGNTDAKARTHRSSSSGDAPRGDGSSVLPDGFLHERNRMKEIKMGAVTPQMSSVDEATAFDIAVEGYTFLYPLLLMETTRRQTTNVERAEEVPLRAPVGAFVHVPVFPPAEFRDVVRPNFDTLYSTVWLDLSEEPQILSVPAAGDNYYLLPLYDMWGEVFACPGLRTTGGEAGEFAIVGPGWSGELPAGVRRYDAPTSIVWMIGRTEASVATYDKVHAFQAGLMVRPLSAWGTEPPAVTGRHDPSVDDKTPPLRQVFAMDAASFFETAAELMRKYPPHFQDYPMLDRLARIGFRAGEPFDLSEAGPVVQAAMTKAVPAAQKKIRDRQTGLGYQVNGWRVMAESMGNYGTNYLARACVELIGLGANLPGDAVYPVAYVDAQGQPFSGARRYVWHLEKHELPPVRAFWSLTLYDDEGFQVANELNRFAIGDRDELQFGTDGSLDILIQHEQPKTGTSNWLPAPEGSFNLCARLYYPKPEVLDGTWAPPAVRPV